MSRRGFTLVELVVVTTLIGFLGLIVGFTLRAAATSTRSAVVGLGRARDLTTTRALLRTSIIGADTADLRLGVQDTLEFDRRLGEGQPCATGGGQLVLADDPDRFDRVPLPGRDEMLVLTQIEPAIWERRPLHLISTTVCPDLRPATAFWTVAGAPARWVRLVTPVRMRAYRSGGATWLGLEDRLGRATLQPFAGPTSSPTMLGLSNTALRVWLGAGSSAFVVPVGPIP